MKHAIMVMGYGKHSNILQQTISILDDKDIDFFIHWDRRYKLPLLKSKQSNIYYIKKRITVHWGSYSQIKAEILLLKAVNRYNIYDYIHLISCNDLPLMTVKYFKKFFLQYNYDYLGFQYPINKEDYNRLAFYYPNNVDFRKHKIIRKIFTLSNKLFRINRLRKYDINKIKKGPNWFSMSSKYIPKILAFKNMYLFKNTLCGDELFLQTILNSVNNFYDNKKVDSNKQASRYIDWKRGKPYIFKLTDIDELTKHINTKYAFVRKIKDPRIGNRLFEGVT